MFETFRVPSMHVGNQGVLSLLFSGKTTGLVIDSGHSVTHVTPIHKGKVLYDNNAVLRLDLAGSDITDFFIKLLLQRGYTISCTAEKHIFRDVKEKLAYVAVDYEEELKKSSKDPKNVEQFYELFDGNVLTIGEERFRCMELLFNPMLIGSKQQGLHDVTYSSIMRCEADIRDEFFSNIVLSGGSTCCTGFAERVQKEITRLAPESTKVKVFDPPGRQYSTWMGGCQFVQNVDWITKEEYDEYGPTIVHKKCI